MSRPINPITTSGWYENADGTVTRHAWNCGRLSEIVTVQSWEAARVYKEAQEAAIDEALSAPPRSDAGVYVAAMRSIHPR